MSGTAVVVALGRVVSSVMVRGAYSTFRCLVGDGQRCIFDIPICGWDAAAHGLV